MPTSTTSFSCTLLRRVRADSTHLSSSFAREVIASSMSDVASTALLANGCAGGAAGAGAATTLADDAGAGDDGWSAPATEGAAAEAPAAGAGAAASAGALEEAEAAPPGAEAALFGDPPQPMAIISDPTSEPHLVIP
ncbi:MAG: hypothetical protein ACLQVI_03210 [Polyangiaceae bacterium]